MDWIFIGKKRGVDAVVCEVSHLRALVTYLNPYKRAMKEWAVWREGHWAFEQTGPCSSFADTDEKLQPFVLRLQTGKRG